jgi:hypothetical protein
MFVRLLTVALTFAVISPGIADSASANTSPYSPDAWARGNDANTSYFGWDDLEISGPPNHGFLWLLDDVTPDLGSGITATGARIHQGADGAANPAPTTQGHVSSSGNYYSFFDTANDTITATAPGSGPGGFTTVVLQVHSTAGGSLLDDLQFAMDNSVNTWTLHKHLNNAGARGLGFHWIEWSAPGAGLPFSIHMTSVAPHRTIDAFELDTYWLATAPAVNAISSVPEPAAIVLAGLGMCLVHIVRRRREVRIENK